MQELIEKYKKADKFHDKFIVFNKMIKLNPRTDFSKIAPEMDGLIKTIARNIAKGGLRLRNITEQDNKVVVTIGNPNTKSYLHFNLVDEVDEDLEQLLTLDKDMEWPPEGYSKKIDVYSKKHWVGVSQEELDNLNEK